MQTTNLSVVYVPGAYRFDVTATISVQTLASFSIQAFGLDCTATFDASPGSLPNWTVSVQMPFVYDPANGDVHILTSSTAVTGVEAVDWQSSGDFLCTFGGGIFTSALMGNVFLATLDSYWASVGMPLCEHPAPELVGQCPE
jgi:hypothetical protein